MHRTSALAELVDKAMTTEIPETGSAPTNMTQEEPGTFYKPTSADMLFYYERFLPFRAIFQWLNHSPKVSKDFTMREFAFEHRSGAYQRYNSYSSLEEFKKSVISANPMRFEIGATYTVDPKERRNLPKNAMKPVSKELVFDIDLTDYDTIRNCCQGTDICKKCWRFIQVGSQVIECALREDFGFKNILWVFSGRRGAHCWVSDARARLMDEATRKSIVEYMDVLGAKQPKFSNNKRILTIKKPYHPHIERSFGILVKSFEVIILNEQNLWFTSQSGEAQDKAWEQIEILLSFIPEILLQNELRALWKGSLSLSASKTKWEDINIVALKVLKSTSQINALNEAKRDIIIYYMYPRLDVEVSRQVIHLLKSPFCIHPGTGIVCVPFNPKLNISDNIEDDTYGFNPMTAPNIRKIQTEFENFDACAPNTEANLADYEKTCLKPYINYFIKFVSSLMTDELKGISGKRSLEQDAMAF